MMQKDGSLSEWATRLSPKITEVKVLVVQLVKGLDAAPDATDCDDPPLIVPTRLVLKECRRLMDEVWGILESVGHIVRRLGG